MAELDFEPFSAEAFPGLEFYLSGTRDNLTLSAIETSGERHVGLLSLARQGYIVRHQIPGDFAAIPPRDDGRLPLEGQPGLARQRPAEDAPAPRGMRIPMPGRLAPAPAPQIIQHFHETPFADRAQMRLRPMPDPLRGDGGGNPDIALEIYTQYNWRRILTINSADGRIRRWMYGNRNTIIDLRAAGLCMSRDGGVAVYNPTAPRNGRPAPQDADEDAIPPTDLIDPALPPADQVFAFRERMAAFKRFLEANVAFPHRVPGLNIAENAEGVGRIMERLTAARERLLANPNADQWRDITYIWREGRARWEYYRGDDAENPNPMIPRYMDRLPRPLDEEARHDTNDHERADRRVANGWNRHAWVNIQTGEYRAFATNPPDDRAAPQPQGGGEGALAAVGVPGPVAGGWQVQWRDVADGVIRVAEPAPAREYADGGPHNPGILTAAMRDRLADMDLWNAPYARGVTCNLVTIRRTHNDLWQVWNEEAGEINPTHGFIEAPSVYVIDQQGVGKVIGARDENGAVYREGHILRFVIETNRAGTRSWLSLTTALRTRINDLIAGEDFPVIGHLEVEADDDFAGLDDLDNDDDDEAEAEADAAFELAREEREAALELAQEQREAEIADRMEAEERRERDVGF